jgi:site-specific recombinase XerD
MAVIDEFLAQKRAEGWAHRSIVTQCKSMRSFFRFAEMQGWCAPDRALGIRGPRVSKIEAGPKGPSWTQVRQLLNLTQGTKPEQRRAKALLLLLTVYGPSA